MNPGKFRQRIQFQRKTVPEPQDNFGAPQEIWVPATEIGNMGDGTVWCKFEALNTSKFGDQVKRFADSTARFHMRYIPDIDSDMYRILMIFDPYASPIVTSIWNLFPPINVEGRLFEMYIEASEII